MSSIDWNVCIAVADAIRAPTAEEAHKIPSDRLRKDKFEEVEGSIDNPVQPVQQLDPEGRSSMSTTCLIAAVLSPAQQTALDYFRALNVPASWFIGEPGEDGSVEVLARGKPGSIAMDDPGQTFVWTILVRLTAKSTPPRLLSWDS